MKAILFAAVAAAALAGAPASARVLIFTITNVGGTDRGDFSFQLDEDRVPDIVTASSVRFAAVNGGVAVPVTYSGVPNTADGIAANGGVTFFTQVQQGGIAISGVPGGNFLLRNTTLITNTAFNTALPRADNKPVFKIGTFALSTTPQNTGPRPFDNYSVTIADSAVAIPEPATWAMMLTGFGAIGFGARRKARLVAA